MSVLARKLLGAGKSASSLGLEEPTNTEYDQAKEAV